MHGNLKKVFDELRIEKKFSLDQMHFFVEEFNDRFWKALQKVLERGVKKYTFVPSNRTAWIVVGNKRDYLIISDLYCSCEDFYLNVVVRKFTKMCYHLLSKVLATTFEEYEKITVEDARYEQLMKDWKQI